MFLSVEPDGVFGYLCVTSSCLLMLDHFVKTGVHLYIVVISEGKNHRVASIDCQAGHVLVHIESDDDQH